MVLNFLRKIFSKKRRTYVVAASDGVAEPSPDHPNFEEENTDAQLIRASRLSPLMWRHLFPRSPAAPIELEHFESASEADGVSRDSYTTRGSSASSSAGYGSQTSDESPARLGASSMGYSSGGGSVEAYSSTETSPVIGVKTVRFWDCEYGTPISSYSLHTPETLPPKTPHRSSFLRREMRRKPSSYGQLEKAETEESSFVAKSCLSEADILSPTPHPTLRRGMFTPSTLPPKTPHRSSLSRQVMRPTTTGIYPVLDLEMLNTEEESSSSETKEAAEGSIWGEPVYSPASLNDLLCDESPPSSPEDSPCCSHFLEGSFVRHENRKHSLRRKPSAPVSGRVKQMIQFFENDSTRVEIPRRLDQVPAEYIRSCPQMLDSENTPARPSDGHTQSRHVRGITHSSDRCIRCPSYYKTPVSRRSMA